MAILRFRRRGGYFILGLFLIIPICVISEIYAATEYISLLAMCLLILIVFAILFTRDDGVVTPLTLFSLMYSGYAIGAIYYAQSDGYFGKFIEFSGLGRHVVEQYMIQSLLLAIACYFTFWFGYALNIKRDIYYLQPKSDELIKFISKNKNLLIFPLILFVFLYWVWVCFTISGGVINALIEFQLFPHLAKDNNITIAPYLIYYAAINIWFICMLCSPNQSISKSFVFWALVGFIISISTARITISISYILSLLVFAYLVKREYRSRLLVIGSTLLLSSFVIYVLREFSNYYFLYGDISKVDFNFLTGLIGGGNITDLQQLVIILNAFSLNNSLLGSSYLDWINNFVGVYFGMEPNSLGLLIHEMYMPDSSGAPTPGAVGELYANFNILSPLVIFFIGFLMAAIRNFVLSKSNILLSFCYAVFLVCFVFMYPKVDSTMFVNFIWGVVPTLLIVYLCYPLYFITVRINCINAINLKKGV
ncbi:oligosaccharide repeat unit polymerase [Aeromonas veronii]|nr:MULTISPECIES: O-antigen polymerase [Aeromonas]HDN9003975.1 oligosaccharide repeat unit polymerase [Aeromonas veronii AMC24]MCF5761071.1 oligosaccharide repeat unit polymerase [Aeromonas veronii]MCF5852148.1 oligosaccharide repeat unit polymerase [Aeromonas veronii]OLF58563.1 hypothetical protein BTN33_13330 [Aeromonas veronii]QWZ84542.1 oligosaccharide repeat unit polymerase [Aeromonas sp. FDAARGOS 1404]